MAGARACAGIGSSPTHVAVALKYDQKEMVSPVVLANAYDRFDQVAQMIKAMPPPFPLRAQEPPWVAPWRDGRRDGNAPRPDYAGLRLSGPSPGSA